ncbi:prepilin-type N-terminal cleavage/methylation domain-containing protein [Aestuariirhabdus sp. Z084]|uniref:prepilin-type N-terminal cleavage/methylation domain-containing protein n=1 Tax=Aestuariirhabdus haliotis TaxID=2918751 RepID=UPI00201B3AC3|nr:prepilin-type N-terminal cleavage/methylation domain-containing protein [Aestuariirhabdus haliotis]MCL6414989.1 prepilin-type N-terminal cleavage/methylation domain-containing protein [Aestuariirhabdus haliotis]MCL6418921.1 prepilin-type N-terminal cleavage/methylation domain-containing protein [Aestuariirhabdus haliotis]
MTGGSTQRGLTLIELVISIVIGAIAAAAIFGAMASIGGRNADPMLQQQAQAIASAYMDEIYLQSFVDPSLPVTSNPCTGPAAVSRATFNDVCDYDGLSDNGVVDANGNSIAALSLYDVAVNVDANIPWQGIAGNDVLRIRVVVTTPAGQNLLLTSYRTRY